MPAIARAGTDVKQIVVGLPLRLDGTTANGEEWSARAALAETDCVPV